MSTATATQIQMPRLSDSMEEGTIVGWLVGDGDEVQIGQEIAEIETDKATMPFEAEVAGMITIHIQVGEAVAVGAVIATIGPERAPTAETRSAPMAESPKAGPSPQVAPPSDLDTVGRANASPLARRIAADLRVELSALTGTGPGGRIVRDDVERAAAAVQPEPSEPASPTAVEAPPAATAAPPATERRVVVEESAKGSIEVRELSRLQAVIARRMAQSKATAPEFVLITHVDMEAAVTLRDQLREMLGADSKPPSFNDFVVKACALALRDEPLANGSYVDGHFELHGRINIGIAVAAPDALVVPTIFDADQKSLGEIAREARRLAEKVRVGTITPPELSGGTFSVSNLGMYGIDEFTAVLNPPQAAILAVGRLEQRAVVREGQLAARHMMTITMSCDHRILYGANAAQLLARVRSLLETPGALVL